MKLRIALIILLVSAFFVLPARQVRADFLLLSNPTIFPPHLTPPAEDVDQLDEESDDESTSDVENDKPFDIPVVLNNSVEKHIGYFKTRGRDVFQLWLDRSARYIDLMRDIFREKNLPEDLVYVAMIESGFNTSAVSWARAVGPWQFMAATGRLYGLKINWWVDERRDPVKSTYAAADHLKDLVDRFGSWPMALASYNAGAGKVQRAVIRTRSDDFWDLKASRYLMKETKNYVPAFMAATIIAKNAEAYGFSVPASKPLEYDEVVIEESTDLRLIARCADSTYETIKELNPELRRWVTPPHVDSYVIRIPAGKKESFLENYAAIPPGQRITWERHEVRRGETLSSIAGRYKTTIGAIRDVNNLKRNRIYPGKHLLIPVAVDGNEHVLENLSPERDGKRQTLYHRVRRGESLSKIAQKYQVTVSLLREWNGNVGTMLRPGQKLKLVLDADQI